MKRILAGALLLACAASAQQLRFTRVPQTTIEQRLRAYVTANSEREPALRRLFEEVGCKGSALTEQTVKGAKAPNLVCTQTGSKDSTIVVGAHLDKTEAGDGVVDNWSGAALLSSLYQGLTSESRQHTFVFVGFAGEEAGLKGSRAFVHELGNGRDRVKAMVNMDTLGLSDTKVWVSHADPELVRWMGLASAAMKRPVTEMNVDRVGMTDSESFRDKKIPAITVHSLTQETLPILHSPKDKVEAIHLDAYYQTYELMLGYLVLLDQKLE